MTERTFDRFSPDLFKFLEELQHNNNKVWFAENKSRYKDVVVSQLLDFIVAINQPLRKISKHYIADPRGNGGSMFRIYRDVRFSKDKTPYKEHAACQFRHEAGKDAHAPGFYLHLATDKVIFGGGVWLPPSDILYKIRERIRDNSSEWKRVKENKTLLKYYPGIHGDGLTRPPKGFDKSHHYIDDIKRKSFFAMREVTPAFARKSVFFDEVIKTYQAATPLMKFICQAIDLPY